MKRLVSVIAFLSGVFFLIGTLDACGLQGSSKRAKKVGEEKNAEESSDDFEPIDDLGDEDETPPSENPILVSEETPLETPIETPLETPSQEQAVAQTPSQIPIEILGAGTVSIKSVSYQGTGCPEGTVASDVSEDKKALTLVFDKFSAAIGPSIDIKERTKNCRIKFDLDVPAGMQFTIFQVDYRGYADLDPGTAGLHSAAYFFSDQHWTGKRVKIIKKFKAPFKNDFESRHKVGLITDMWSRCGVAQTLTLDTALALGANSGKEAVLTLDSIDGELAKQKFHMAWRRCQ